MFFYRFPSSHSLNQEKRPPEFRGHCQPKPRTVWENPSENSCSKLQTTILRGKKAVRFRRVVPYIFLLRQKIATSKTAPKKPLPKKSKKTNECLADFFFEKKSAVFFLIFSFGGKNSKHFPWVGLGLSRSRRDWKSNAWDVAPGVFCSRVPRRHFPATKRRFFGSQLLSRYLRSPEPLGT